MKKYVICLLSLVLFLLSSSVFATNWVYYGRSTIVAGNLYIDADLVNKNGDDLTYWELLIYDKPIGVTAKLRTKYEVKLAPSRKYCIVDTHYFLADNSDDKVMNEWNDADTTTGGWADSYAGTDMSSETDFSLKYAKEGQASDQKPDINQTPQN